MGDRGRQLAHRRDAVRVRQRHLRLAILPLAFASFCLALPQCLLCALELVNIHVHPDPLQQGSIARPERFDATAEPAVASLSVTNSKTLLSELARAQTG